ncbi:MAG TPA: hypothetical protein DCX19_03875, partial [Alphaproteobacteria bacterium]|nr:hypothetical protein [Alphaproteobacteria bacterium]
MNPLALILALALFPFGAAAADKKTPVDFSADELTYDRSLNLIIARGNVTFSQNDSSLRADHVNYSADDGVVIASGNVEIYTPDGGLMRANYARLSGDLKDGLIRKIRYTLSDKSVLTAKDAEHIQGDITEFTDVAYSSCDFCEDGSRFWEIKAKRMTHDKAEKSMTARNATMTVADVPILYIPYFSYPDPTVKRKSGFLLPGFKSNKAMGAGVTVPYYWEINPYTDLTLTPWIATKGVLWSGDFRRNFTRGETEVKGSFIRQDGRDRYNIDATAEWHVTDVWRASLNVDTASDDTYLRRYGLRDTGTYDPWLKSDLNIEALTADTYFYAGGAHYQNMRSDIADDTIPETVPQMRFSHVAAPSESGGYWSFDADAVSLSRKTGDDSRRATVEAGWHLPGITGFGAVYDFHASALASAYRIDDYAYVGDGGGVKTFNGEVAAFNPQASLKVSYPFVSVGENYNQIFEPVVMGVVAPNSENSRKIPNEDSSDLEFDDTNLFSEKRFAGYDVFEPGSRVNYGLKWSAYGKKSGSVSVLVGQSYRFNKSYEFPADSGLAEQASDIVGRVGIYPNDFIGLQYAFRMNRKTL